MKTLLIVFHSVTGGTRQMAEAAAEGARADDIRVCLSQAPEVLPADLLQADGYLFATPENLAAISGLMKDFFDRCYYPAIEKVNGRPYASLVCAGSDGSNAARQIERIATGWRLKMVAAPLIIRTEARTEAEILAPKRIAPLDLVRCRELGAAIAAGLAMGIF